MVIRELVQALRHSIVIVVPCVLQRVDDDVAASVIIYPDFGLVHRIRCVGRIARHAVLGDNLDSEYLLVSGSLCIGNPRGVPAVAVLALVRAYVEYEYTGFRSFVRIVHVVRSEQQCESV